MPFSFSVTSNLYKSVFYWHYEKVNFKEMGLNRTRTRTAPSFLSFVPPGGCSQVLLYFIERNMDEQLICMARLIMRH